MAAFEQRKLREENRKFNKQLSAKKVSSGALIMGCQAGIGQGIVMRVLGV